MTAARVRRARPDDIEGIVAIVRAGLSPGILPFTIYGAAGITAFLRHELDRPDSRIGDCFVLEGDGRVLGFAEFRQRTNTVFLNNIYVSAPFSGKGGGTLLLGTALQHLCTVDKIQVELDAFDDNRRALAWYRRLGFEVTSRTVWSQSLHPIGTESTLPCRVEADLADADRMHAIYGFSEFVLSTTKQERVVGRIGSDLFRVTGDSILRDSHALEQLRMIDGNRRILCIESGRTSDRVGDLVPTRVLTSSTRMRAAIHTVLGSLRR